MKYVYILRSVKWPNERYIGITTDFKRRLIEHNSGKSPHTSKFRPWVVDVSIRFQDDSKADKFEKYLKSGSGYAFSKRHFK